MAIDLARLPWKIYWKILRNLKILKEKLSDYDFSKNHSLKELGFSTDEANIYSATPNYDLAHVLKNTDIQPTDSILDFGAGKGAAMLTMSKFKFDQIHGVELSESMHQIGQQNLEKLGLKNAEIFLSNATGFKDLDRYTFFYFFNPFPDNVLEVVIENIKMSHNKRPRNISILYYLPAYRHVIDKDPFFQLFKSYPGRYFEMLIYTNTTTEENS